MRVELGLCSAAEAYDAATVALGGAALGQGRVHLHSFALGGGFGARFFAGLTLAIEGLRHNRGAAHLAQRENFNLKVAALVLDDEIVADTNLAGGFGFVAVGEDAAQVAGLGGQRAGFEEARRPKPFVDAQGVHEDIVVQEVEANKVRDLHSGRPLRKSINSWEKNLDHNADDAENDQVGALNLLQRRLALRPACWPDGVS